jgi:GNAT superfamily N-acetyltransferase
MRLPGWHEEPIARTHNRNAFDCGDTELNGFLQRYARQSHEQGGAKTFLAIDNSDSGKLLGFYSIAPAALGYERLPAVLRRGLARHDGPGYRLTRIATHSALQGQGLGGQLLAAAARRCILASAEVGGVTLIIDAKNDRAAEWYASYGATPLLDAPRTLVLSLATFAQALNGAEQL